MRVHALSALSLAGLATTAAANQPDRRQRATDEDSAACLRNIVALAEASPTVPASLDILTDGCVPSKMTEAASSFTSSAKAWYTDIVNAIGDCPAWPSESTIPALPTLSVAACEGEQPSSAATATTASAPGNAVATSTNPTTPTTNALSTAASGSAGRSAASSSSQSTNAAARETGLVFAVVGMAAFGAAAL